MPSVVGSGSSPWLVTSSSPGNGSSGANGLSSTKVASNPAENGSSVNWNASSTTATNAVPRSNGRPRAGPTTYDTSHTSADKARIPSADHGGMPSASNVRK